MRNFEELTREERSEALVHLREFSLNLADHRFKNFNIYLILIGVIGAGILNSENSEAIYVLCFLAVAMSIFFFLSDIRAIHFQNIIKSDLEKLEPLFGISVHNIDIPSGRKELFSGYRGRLISFTYTFRAVLLILAVTAVGCAIATVAGLYPPSN